MTSRTAKSKRAPVAVLDTVTCRACGEARAFEDFRVFATAPEVLHMDFCSQCEQTHGTVTLYRRFNAYGTPQIIEAVFRAVRLPEAHRTPDQVRLLVEPKKLADPEKREEVLQREFARRELARRRLIYYVKSFMPDYVPGWIHHDICRRLEKFLRDVEENKAPRLILAVPPRHGKSQLASDMFPSWVLGHHPEWPLIVASYSMELPTDFSRNIRDRLKSEEHRALFAGTQIRPDATGVEAWKTTAGGGIKFTGVGGGLTGFGGRILIADDLIKDAEAAQSEVIRNNTWSWYKMVFRSRVAPGGGILLIGTRWHWHDPTGRALDLDAALAKEGVPEYERENWEVVSYPAIAETDEHLLKDGSIFRGEIDPEDPELARTLRRRGEALHPERWPLNELKKVRNTYTVSDWSALYQQNPTPEEGDFFKKGDIRYRWLDPAYRPLCRRFITVDYAISKKQRRDFTVVGAYALDANDDLYCLEIRRGRWGTFEIANAVADMAEKHKVEIYAGEQGAIHQAVWPNIKLELDKRRIYLTVDETLTPIQDKETRARPLQGRVQRGKFYFSYDEASRPDILDVAEREMLQFPNGVNDDIVDMLAWGARLALNVSLPNAQTPPARQKSWTDNLTAHQKVGNFMAA